MKSLEFSVSLKNNHAFRRLYSKGKSAATPLVVVYCRKNGKGRNQLGITVTKKLGSAVHRNRVRRRLREIYRLKEARFVSGVDLVIVARTRSRYAGYRELQNAVLHACGKLGLLQEERTGGGERT